MSRVGWRVLLLWGAVLARMATSAITQDSATSTAQAATQQFITPSVIPDLPTLTPIPTEAPPTAVPTQPPTRVPTATPQIEGDLITDLGARIDFPDAVEFFLMLAALPEADTRVQLEIEAASLNQRVIVQGVLADFQPEDDAESQRLIYNWQPAPDNAPVLFDTLTYRWTIEGEEADNIASDRVVFTDPRASWITTTIVDGHLSLVTAERSRSRLASNLDQIYRLLQAETGESPDLRFIIYEGGILPACGDEDENCDVYQRSGYIPLAASDGLEPDLTRLLVSAFYAPKWADAGVPDWWLEGFSRYLSPVTASQMLAVSQTAERSGLTFSLDEMAVRPVSAPQQAQWDAQAYGMALYVFSQIGREGVFELAGMPEPTFGESFQLLTEQRLNTLIPGWSRWIFTELAPVVYGLTPYMAVTSTPSITPTPSLTVTPTFTLTPTATATYTFTPDLRTQTEPPTITPLPSATDSPPTSTPRSMSVLLTPEPQSTTATSFEGVNTRMIVAGTLILLIIVLIVVFFLSMRRR